LSRRTKTGNPSRMKRKKRLRKRRKILKPESRHQRKVSHLAQNVPLNVPRRKIRLNYQS